jgi:uncharacterized membrane protein
MDQKSELPTARTVRNVTKDHLFGIPLDYTPLAPWIGGRVRAGIAACSGAFPQRIAESQFDVGRISDQHKQILRARCENSSPTAYLPHSTRAG